MLILVCVCAIWAGSAAFWRTVVRQNAAVWPLYVFGQFGLEALRFVGRLSARTQRKYWSGHCMCLGQNAAQILVWPSYVLLRFGGWSSAKTQRKLSSVIIRLINLKKNCEHQIKSEYYNEIKQK